MIFVNKRIFCREIHKKIPRTSFTHIHKHLKNLNVEYLRQEGFNLVKYPLTKKHLS